MSVSGQLTGKHVLAFVVGFFGLIFAVNGYLVYRAVATHSGEVANEPYRKGLQYNERIAAAERQAELGWTEDISFDRSGELTVVMQDRAGLPVRGLHVDATLSRPATSRETVSIPLRELQSGRYTGSVNKPAPGSYIVDVTARPARKQEIAFRGRARLWLKP